MRHMYDKDGMIPYAGSVRASKRWQSSQTKKPSNRRTYNTRNTEPTYVESRADRIARIQAIATSRYADL